MKLTQRQNDTLLSIEADFDKFVAENFGDICQALAKHLRILIELETAQRNHGINTEELIGTIRRSKDEHIAQNILMHLHNISQETAKFILNTSITELKQVLDTACLEKQIDVCRADLLRLSEL